MKKKILALTITLALTGVSGILLAEGNATAGKAKAASCVGCHGRTGNSTAPLFPKLAGQHEKYLVRQMQAFKDGTRNNPTMQSMVSPLNDADIEDIAAFYTKRPITYNRLPEAEEEEGEKAVSVADLLKIGNDFYVFGNSETKVAACVACHGPSGEGNKPAGFPMLKSQHADYLMQTLKDYRAASRSKNPDNMMQMIAKQMTDQEIKAVSYYISMMK